MIVLDTNVISELSKPHCSAAVLAWLNAQEVRTLYRTTVNLAELMAGVALLDDGRRKEALRSGLLAVINRLFGTRILPFDAPAARRYGELVGVCRRKGISVSMADALIAAIAMEHGFSVATRDVTPFRAAGVEVIEPWTYPGQ